MIKDMETFNIGEMTILGASEETKIILQKRDTFINMYCEEKGWDRDNLSFEQIFEIRKQDGWKLK